MATTETHPKGRSSEETRNLYRQKYEAQIREWNARAHELGAVAAELGSQSWLDFTSSIEGAHDSLKSHQQPPQQKN